MTLSNRDSTLSYLHILSTFAVWIFAVLQVCFCSFDIRPNGRDKIVIKHVYKASRAQEAKCLPHTQWELTDIIVFETENRFLFTLVLKHLNCVKFSMLFRIFSTCNVLISSSPPRLSSGEGVASRAEDSGFESRLRRDFSGSSHISDLKIGTPVATLARSGVLWYVLRLVGQVSVYCDWV